MKDNNVTKNNAKFAGWIEDFITNFAKTTQCRETEAAKETVAEINISDLDKVVWNDETFYVYFGETGASIINAFGNIVASLDGIMTLEEVNMHLNSKQIVSSTKEELVVNADIENEIEKALSEIEVEADATDDVLAQEYVDSYNESTNVSEETTDVTVEAVNETETTEVEEVTEEVVEEDKSNEMFDAKILEMEERLVKKFETMIEQLYARMNPGNVYDMGQQIEQQEVLKFTEEAYETEKQIAEENAVDRTLVDNRYSVEDESEIVNEVVTEEAVELEEIIEETEELVEETEELVEEVEEVVDEQLTEVEETVEVDETVVEEIMDEVETLEESEAEEVTEELDEEIIELEEIEDEEVELEGEDAEVFKTAKCPYCSQSLSKIAMKSDFIEIQCDDIKCGCKFKVNVNTGKIYHV